MSQIVDKSGNPIAVYNTNNPNQSGLVVVNEDGSPLLSSSSITDGTQLTATSSYAQLTATSTPCTEVLVQNDPSSTGNLLVGGTAGIMNIAAGNGITIPVKNVNQIWFKAASGTVYVNWLYRS